MGCKLLFTNQGIGINSGLDPVGHQDHLHSILKVTIKYLVSLPLPIRILLNPNIIVHHSTGIAQRSVSCIMAHPSHSTLNEDVLEKIFESLYEMEPTERTTFHLSHKYFHRMDFPWILPDSRDALVACSLVCQQWRKLSHRRLFRCMCIDSEPFLERVMARLQEGGTTSLPFVVVDLRIEFPSPLILEM